MFTLRITKLTGNYPSKHNAICSALLLCSILYWHNPTASFATTPAPTIKLFPTTVITNLSEMSTTAKAMEEDLHSVILDLEAQITLYKEAQCEGAETDEGCRAIEDQLGGRYEELLSRMEENLPEMEQAVKQTSKSLEKNLRTQLGLKMTPRQLQSKILKKHKQNSPAGRSRSRRTLALSDRFKSYHQLVAMGSRMNGGGSLVEVAANIYLDTKEVSELISLTREEIGRARLMVQLNNLYGVVTPEMIGVVDGVKSVLFGETMETITRAVRRSEEVDFRLMVRSSAWEVVTKNRMVTRETRNNRVL